MAIDFEEDSKALPTDAEIKDIATLVNLMLAKQKAVVRAEAALKLAKDEYNRIALKELPDAMLAARTQNFTTTDGVRVTLKEDLYASIKDSNKAAAYKWLHDNGFGDVIKTKVAMDFGRGEQERLTSLVGVLESSGFEDYSAAETVHAGTLKALLKEQLAQGVEVPLDLFGAFQYKEAMLK